MVTSSSVPETFQTRFASVLQGLSFQQVAQLTGMNAETVRRQIRSGEPSLEFVRAVCVHMNLSADWLLFGVTDTREVQLTRTIEQMHELAKSLERLTEADAFSDTLPSRLTVIDGPLSGRSVRSDLLVNATLTVWYNRDTGQICCARQCRTMRKPWELVSYSLESGRLKHAPLPSAIALGNGKASRQRKTSRGRTSLAYSPR